MEWFTENRIAWMGLLFLGVLYWAFRSRFKNRRRRPGDPNDTDTR